MKTKISGFWDLSRACAMYNRFTCPRALRTDREHKLNLSAARRVKRFLNRHWREGFQFWESDNGRMCHL